MIKITPWSFVDSLFDGLTHRLPYDAHPPLRHIQAPLAVESKNVVQP
jgi:hypothetical protein